MAAKAAWEGRLTFGEPSDYRGAALVAATRGIALTGWGLISRSAARKPLAEYGRDLWVESGTAALFLLALAGWVFGYRRHVWAWSLVPDKPVSGIETAGRRKDGRASPVELGFSPVVRRQGRLLCAAVPMLHAYEAIIEEVKPLMDERRGLSADR